MKRIILGITAALLSFAVNAQLVQPVNGGTGVRNANSKTLTLGGPVTLPPIATSTGTGTTIPLSINPTFTGAKVFNDWLYHGGGEASTTPNTQGSYWGWNRSVGSGETAWVNHRGAGTGGFFFYGTADGTTLTEFMRVTSTGTSVNSTETTARLTTASGVNAAPAASGTSGSGVALRVQGADTAAVDFGTNSGTYTWMQARDTGSYGSNYPLAINPNGGNVGIGTIPSYKFHVDESANARAAYIKNSHASFTDSVLMVDTARAANVAYKLIDAYANGVQKFSVDGVGHLVTKGGLVTGNVTSNVAAATATSNYLNIGVEAKAATGQAGISLISDDASNPLRATIQLVTDPTAANRRLDLGITDGTGTAYPITMWANVAVGASFAVPSNALSVNGGAARSTTQPVGGIDMFNGTAPAGTLTNGATLYVTSGEMRVMDSAGNSTLLSPHDDAGRWVFDSCSPDTGKCLYIEMEALIRELAKSPKLRKYLHEFAYHGGGDEHPQIKRLKARKSNQK